jgi:hypothetical protein
MFVPCIIRRIRNNQHHAKICTTALFYILAPTYFGSSLSSSGSFWIRLSYTEIQIDLVVYQIMLVKWQVWRRVVVPAHRPLNQHYMIYHQIDLYFHVTQTDPEASWWWQATPETYRSQYMNKTVVKICAWDWLFLLQLQYLVEMTVRRSVHPCHWSSIHR